MAWAFGDLAKAAMEKAAQSYEQAIRLSEKVENLIRLVGQSELRVQSQLQDFERRLRDLERVCARLEAKVDGALSDAARAVLFQPEVQRRLSESLAATQPTGSNLPNGHGGGPPRGSLPSGE